MSSNKNRLKILLYLFGSVYFLSFFSFIYLFSIFNFYSGLLALNNVILFTLIIYFFKKKEQQAEHIQNLISEKEKMQFRFTECNHSFNSLFNQVMDGIALLNLQLDFFKTNKSFCDILGYTAEKILTWNLEDLIQLTRLSNHQIGINRLIAGKADDYTFKTKIVKKSGDAIWISISIVLIHDAQNKPYYFIMYAHNLTAQKKAEDYLSYLSSNDPLLQIPNRNQFEKFVGELLKSQNHQKKFWLLLIDLDNFKNINHTLGYEAGNQVLKIVAERLKPLTYQNDLLARLSSDEFVMVLTDKWHAELVQKLANKILIEIAKATPIKRKEVYITASIGISIYPNDGFTTRKLLKHADIALLYAKEQHKNTYKFYTDEMAYQQRLKSKTKNKLSNVLQKNELTVQYQPRFKAGQSRVVTIQVLPQLIHANRMEVDLFTMMSLVNDIGLTALIYDAFIKQVFYELNTWYQLNFADLIIAIPCHSAYIKQPFYVDNLLNLINTYHLPAHSVQLEFAEGCLTFFSENNDEVVKNYAILQQAGIKMVIDAHNFLESLFGSQQKFYFDKIKLNAQLIRQQAHSASLDMIKAIVMKAASMHVGTIAESIENANELEILTQCGCDELQGSYLSPILSSEKVNALLNRVSIKTALNENIPF